MKSTRQKVLHEIAGRPMLTHVVQAALEAGSSRIAVVIGPDSDNVRTMLTNEAPDVRVFEQTERLGTAHAALAARAAICEGFDDVLVVFGDTPLLLAETLAMARKGLSDDSDVVVCGFRTTEPRGYGRLIENQGTLVAIREEKDCSDEERKITFCNGGLMAIAGEHALTLLDDVGNDNAKGEYYMSDIVGIARDRGMKVTAVEGPFEELLGINNQAELATAENIWQERRRRELMLAGVSMQAPGTVFLSHDTQIGRDCFIEPHVWFGPGVTVGDGVRIRAFSHIEGATIGDQASVGPFARLRPGARLAEGSKVGNFCEVKQADIGRNAKVNHLTYVGDATIGEGANIGAGTITCNYDGYNKYRTEIGARAFIGSNTALVAPVKVGDDTIVAAGSVVSEDVPDKALAVGRARQTNYERRAVEINARNAAARAKK